LVGARARPELLPTTRRWFLSATWSYAARASRMSRGEGVSVCWERTRRCPA